MAISKFQAPEELLYLSKFHTEGPTDNRRHRTGVCAPLVMIMCPVVGTDVRTRSVLGVRF